MNIALFYYDDFVEFEIVLVGLLFHQQHQIMAVALESREYKSAEGQRFCVDQVLSDVSVDSIDLLVIPGGDPARLVNSLELKNFLEKMIAMDRKVAGICGGAEALAGMGLLKGRKCTGGTEGEKPGMQEYAYFTDTLLSDEQVVVDGNFITAQGRAYVEFALELSRQMGVTVGEQAYQKGLRFFRNVR